MVRKTYWKEFGRAFTQSKGRFFSIFSLMGIGALALIGLKVTTPDMQEAAQTYLTQYQTMDLAIMADYGLSEADVEELMTVEGARLELGYLTDRSLADGSEAMRIFSLTDEISQFELLSGKMPEAENEIALSRHLAADYQIGDELILAPASTELLKHQTFKVTGFIASSEVWSEKAMGASSVGSGDLTAFAVATQDAFVSDHYLIARLTFDDLENEPFYSSAYQDRLAQHQNRLEQLLADNGDQRLATIRETNQATIDEGYEKIAQAEKALAEQEEELVQLEQASKLNPQLAQSLDVKTLREEFNREKTKIEKEIAESKASLEEAEEELASLTVPAYTTYTRETFPSNNGYLVYKSGTEAISAVGNIFPVVLYGVAAMVTLTTMTRFVDEERTKAGIFKALGYSKGQIIAKFVLYGLGASFLGGVVGSLLGNFLVSPMISRILAADTVLGQIRPRFHLDWFLLALGTGFLSAVLPAYLVARGDLSEETTKLLQAKPPVAGSKILLERLTPLWNRLSFTHKVTARNIFRYKQRMAMTIFGVAGSVALLFAGLGIQSSISGVATTQFDDLIGYQMILVDNSRATQEDRQELDAKLTDDRVSQTLPFQFETQTLAIDGVESEQTVNFFIAEADKLSQFMTLRQRASGELLQLTDDGIIISEKLAKLHHLSVGDDVQLSLADEVRDLRVAGITEMYAGHFIYLTPNYYQKLTQQEAKANAHLVSLKDKSSQSIKELATDFLALPALSAVVQNTALENSLKTIAQSLQSIMLILITLSVLLGMVILYNLTNINVAERLRELSTIKVLGFHNREVTLYIYRETIVLSLVGIATGLLTGVFLHRLLIEMIASPFIMFKPSVDWTVYLAPILSITAILTVLGIIVNHKLRRVDMLEALKSLE